ncbi:phytanoyl-CoA dioxygenase [Pandoraea terrae]|uniref:Phytanoyl-CoA dioxygenase n=1 Tax=Pandoraea terrae TaxID=1537710 RepID=A0A5E4W9V3_9BURK|nr:phytanoyl-CoA dioxygenase family protein [Pandoraea terrae]VVE20649.1 phytanoyl-CoA dioxygenase [Pandoraea terrae]
MNAKQFLTDYRQHGIIFPLQALSESEVCQAQEHYLRLCDPGKVVAEGEQRVFGHLLHPWIAQLVAHPIVLDAVRSVIGPNVLVWVSEFNTKAPNTSNFFSWHQDLYYWRHHYDDLRTIPLVTTWLALTHANEGNGGMRVLPGSHTRLLPHAERPCRHNMLTRAQEICVSVDEDEAVPVNLAAGEFSIHHPLLYHASGPNASDRARIGLVSRYVAPEVTPPVRPAYTWLVSGEDSHGHWDHVAPLNPTAGQALRSRCMQSVQNATGARFK